MKIVVIGTGYVALSTAVSLSKLGHNVICVDNNVETVEALSNAVVTINEQDLPEMLARSIKEERIRFTTNLKEALQNTEIIICGVVTPINKRDGSADNTPILKLAQEIGDSITSSTLYISVSTIPLGTTRQVKAEVDKRLSSRNIKLDFDIASMPEFLREGGAIESFFNPTKVVVGSDNNENYQTIISILSPILKDTTPIYRTSIEEAELIKLASNMLVAARISYMNTIAETCDKIGVEYSQVHKAIFGAVPIYAGAGYSGECFPKDIRTLISGVEQVGADATMIKAVEEFNQNHKLQLYYKLKNHYTGDLQGKKITIFGVATKRGSADIENTPSIDITTQLLREGCDIALYDSHAAEKFANRFINENIKTFKDKYEALNASDALLIFTDATEFKDIDLRRVKDEMRTPLVLDAKNLFNNKDIEEADIIYYRLFE